MADKQPQSSPLFAALMAQAAQPKPQPTIAPQVSVDPNNPIVKQLAKQFGQ